MPGFFPITYGSHVAAAAGSTRDLTRYLARYMTRSTRHCNLSERASLYCHTQGAAGGDVPRVPDARIGGRHRQRAHHREGADLKPDQKPETDLMIQKHISVFADLPARLHAH